MYILLIFIKKALKQESGLYTLKIILMIKTIISIVFVTIIALYYAPFYEFQFNKLDFNGKCICVLACKTHVI